MLSRCLSVVRYVVLVGLFAVVLAACGAAPAPALSEPARRVDALVAEATRAGQFAGVVLVAEGDEVLIERAYNVPDDGNETVTPETPFPIASVTKLFTAVLIMQLVEQGRLELDAPISSYLPAYPRAAGEQITARHLLTFTSGLPNYELQTENPIDAYLQPHTLDDFAATYLTGAPEAVPGTRFSYSNGDYVLLTQVIEAVTGKPWPEVLRAQILEPLEMRDTGVIGTDEPGVALTSGTFIQGGRAQPDPAYVAGNYFGSGAMYSTAADLLRFERGLATNKILSAESRQRMLTPDPALQGAALGSWVYEVPVGAERVRLSEIRGATWGIGTALISDLSAERTIILLANRRDVEARHLEELTQGITAALAAPEAPSE